MNNKQKETVDLFQRNRTGWRRDSVFRANLGAGWGGGILGGVAFLEKQQLPSRQLSGQGDGRMAVRECLRLKWFEGIFIDSVTKPPSYGKGRGGGIKGVLLVAI